MNPGKTFQPTSDQAQALERILEWVRRPDGTFLTLGGYAGTGKTTLVTHLRELLHKEKPKLAVAFCAFTGKATQNLASRLREARLEFEDDRCSTIHGLIYEAETDEEGALVHWRRRSGLDAALLVVDEASMLSEEIWKDLLKYGIPILAVGDHGQLPPIQGKFSLMVKPMLRLEKIHRQAEGSPIIQLSLHVRQNGSIPFGRFGSGVVKHRLDEVDVSELVGSPGPETLILCGRNSTRIKLNKMVRQMLERESHEPVSGDRVICLRNNWRKQLFNGQIGRIKSVQPDEEFWYRAKIEFEDSAFEGRILKEQFHKDKAVIAHPKLPRDELGELFVYGYALTVHKAQGSQARDVIVFEERLGSDDDVHRRWLYTAVTRAQERLTVLAHGPRFEE